MIPRVVGFTGLAGAGKSTAARFVACSYPDFCKQSFADPLRDMLEALGLHRSDMQEGKNVPHKLLGGRTPRQALQTLGTEWGRNLISPTLWLDLARHRLEEAKERGGSVVFDDVRFDNEADLIHELGGVVIHIGRVGLPVMDHLSERGISEHLVNHSIDAGDMESLRVRVLGYLNGFALR